MFRINTTIFEHNKNDFYLIHLKKVNFFLTVMKKGVILLDIRKQEQ